MLFRSLPRNDLIDGRMIGRLRDDHNSIFRMRLISAISSVIHINVKSAIHDRGVLERDVLRRLIIHLFRDSERLD